MFYLHFCVKLGFHAMKPIYAYINNHLPSFGNCVYCINSYAKRKVRIGTIPELYLREVRIPKLSALFWNRTGQFYNRARGILSIYV